MEPTLSRETELVFASASVASPPPALPLSSVGRLDAATDWEAVVALSRRHGLEGSTYRALAPFATVPREVLQELRALYYSHASRHRVIASEVERVASLLEGDGVRPVVVKGVVVAAAAYDDATLRVPGDIDILVGPDEFARARNLLIDDGYDPRAQPEEERALRDTGLGYELLSDSFCIELHDELVPRSFGQYLDEGGMLSRASTRAVMGADIPTLSPADELLFLCVHGAKHAWDTGRWIRDIAGLLLQCTDTVWSELEERAARLGCLRMVLLGVRLAERHFDAPVSDSMRAALARDRKVDALAGDVVRFLVAEPDVGELHRRAAFHLAVRERRRDRIRAVRHQFRLATSTSARDRALVELPRQMWGLYPIIRGLRLGVLRAPDSIRHAVRLVRAALTR